MTRSGEPRDASPVRPVARRGASLLEEALVSVRELPKVVDRTATTLRLSEVIAAVRRLAESELDHVDHLERLDDAISQCADLAEVLAVGTGEAHVERLHSHLTEVTRALRSKRNATIEAVVAEQERVLKAPAQRTQAPSRATPFRASVGRPSVFELPSSVIPSVDEPAGPEDPIDDAEGDERELVAAPVAVEEPLPQETRLRREHLRAAARDGLGDLAALWTLRRPLPKQPWTISEPFEQRMLDVLDFLMSLEADGRGDSPTFSLLEQVHGYAHEVTIADPGRAFARAFLLSCLRGADAAAAVMVSLRQARGELLPAYRDALVLGSNPRLDEALRELLSTGDAQRLAVALDVLRFRRAVDLASTVPLLAHPDVGVAMRAAHALSFATEKHAAREALAEALQREEDGGLALALAESLCALHDPRGLQEVRRRLQAFHDDDAEMELEVRNALVRLLALAGGREDRELLERSLSETPEGALAAGFYGHSGLVESWLLPVLAAASYARSGNPWVFPVELAATRALHRISGAEPKNPPDVREFRQDQFDLATHHDTWARTWSELQGQLPSAQKLRFGAPFTPGACLTELGGPTVDEDRHVLALEYRIASRGDFDLELDDWVPKQRLELSALEESEKARRYEPGSWPWLRPDPAGGAGA